MKKIFLSLSLASLSLMAAADYTTPGNGVVFTPLSLSFIDESGVTALEEGSYLVSSDITISEEDSFELMDGDILYMADGVTIVVEGEAMLNPELGATILPADSEALPLGFKLYGNSAMKNLDIEGIGVIYYGAQPFVVENCDFTNCNGEISLYGALVFSSANYGNVVSGCTFTDCVCGAIQSPVLLGAGGPQVLIEDCVITNVSTSDGLRPFINLSSCLDAEIVIRNNTLIGNKLERPGGIGVSNMMNYEGENKVILENNYVKDCSWGLNFIGGMDVTLLNNSVIDNCWDSDVNGGIAITMYSMGNYPMDVYAENNIIEGNKWGPCNVIASNVNFGKTDDPQAEDYNPGNNIFRNNGHLDADGNQVDVDFCNNASVTAYAQGNVWNDATTLEEAAATIQDNNYNPAYGPVIYDPIRTSIETRITPSTVTPKIEGSFSCYDLNGNLVFTGTDIREASLPAGIYVVKAANLSTKIVVR